MQKYYDEARIVITHGGPASFISAISAGKTPIVMPRQKKFYEHVNDHQDHFCREVEKRFGNIVVVEDKKELKNALNIATKKKKVSSSNNAEFNSRLLGIILEVQ